MARRAALRHHQHDDELPARKRTRRSITASSSPSASNTLIRKSSRKEGNAAVKELTNEHLNKSSRSLRNAHANANADKLDHTPNGGKGNMQSTVDDDAEDAAHETLGEGFYQIEAIRKKRMHKGQTQYLIKWQGWPESANTWEPFDNVNTCADMIEDFEQSSCNRQGKRGRGRRSSGKMFSSQENRENLSEAVKKGTSIKLGESTTDDDVGLGTQKVAKVLSETELVVTERFLHDKKKARQDNLGCDEDKLIFKTGEIDEVVHEILEDSQDSILHKTPSKHFQESPAECKATESFLHAHGERSQVDRKVDLLQKETDSPRQEASTQKDASQERKQSIRKKSDSHVESSVGISPSKRKDSKKRKQEAVPPQSLDPKEPVTIIAGDKSRVSMLENKDGFCKHQEQGIQEDLPASSPIVKILKAVNHAEVCLDGEKDVTVLFKASRADGSEALVNNKYMRERYPMPLIDFYEKHLRYGASTM